MGPTVNRLGGLLTCNTSSSTFGFLLLNTKHLSAGQNQDTASDIDSMGGVVSSLPYVGISEVSGRENVIKTCKSSLAELIGTMFLVLVGCGSCLGDTSADFVRIALAFGVTVATMAQSIGHVSGCHINPAVTAGLLFGRKIGLVKSIFYVVAQCLGAVIGAGLLLVLAPENMRGADGLGKTALGEGVTAGQGFGIEFLITFVLVMVVFGAAADDNNAPNVKGSAPLAIGLSITTCHMFAIPFTGSSMNPARTFGPAAILSDFTNHWVYWVGPILGGICASIVYQMVLMAPSAAAVPLPAPDTYNAVATSDNDKDTNEKEATSPV